MRRRGAVVLLALWLGSSSAIAPGKSALDVDSALAGSQAVLGKTVRNHMLLNTAGQIVELDSLRGKPLLVSMIYTSCPDICLLTTKQLASVVDVAREAVGEDRFNVISVGFDADVDTPDRMRRYAQAQGVEPSARWLFLSADRATIAGLSEDLGFSFAPSPRGFDHITQVSVLDAEHRVYRQVYGEFLLPPSIVEPLKELVFGTSAGVATLQGWIDGIRLLCTVYDPASGRYGFDYSVFVAAFIGALCLGWIAYFLVVSWREHRRSPTS